MQSTQGAVFLIFLFASIILLWLAIVAWRSGKRRAFRGLMLAFGLAAVYPLISIADIYRAPDPRECFHHVIGFHPGREFTKILVQEKKGWFGSHRAFIKFNAGPDTRVPTLNGLRISQVERRDWQEYLPADVPGWWQLPADAPTFKAHYSVERQITNSGSATPGKVVFFGYDTATGESFVYMDEP